MKANFKEIYSSVFFNIYNKTNNEIETQNYLNNILYEGFNGTNINDQNIKSLVPQNTKSLKENVKKLVNDFDYEKTIEEKDNSITISNIGSLVERTITNVGLHDQKSDGAFYTPHTHIDFMCRESIVERLNEETTISVNTIRNFIFDEGTINKSNSRQISSVLEELTVVDPSCGAGDFLIGMIRVFIDVLERLKHPVNKNPINIVHGADANKISVLMTRFRLQLTAEILSTQFNDENIVCGDSLVQTVNDTFIPASFNNGLPPELYQHSSTDTKPNEILKSYIRETNKDKITTQQTLTGKIKNKKIENENDKINWINNNGGFFWQTAFSDVMKDGGFSIVIGNPPYVSKEEIHDPNNNYDPLDYKKQLQKYTEEEFNIKPARNSDLYVYFFFKSIELLSEGGVASYVTSNSWLDSRYGHQLRHGLLKHSDVRLILDTDECIFEEAEINSVTSIVVNSKNKKSTKFAHISNKDIINNYLKAINSKESNTVNYLDESMDVFTAKGATIVQCNQELLWKQGTNNKNKLQKRKYDNGKWSIFLQAPFIFYKIIDEDVMKPMKEHTDVTIGTKCGSNDFFYVPNSHHSIVRETKNSIVLSNRDSPSITYTIPKRGVSEVVLGIQSDKESISSENNTKKKFVITPSVVSDCDDVIDYIQWAEDHDPSDCESCPSKRKKKLCDSPSWANHASTQWYNILPQLKSSKLLLRETIDTSFGATLLNDEKIIDGTLYGVSPPDGVEWTTEEYEAMTAILNSTLCILLFEVYGRSNYGGGALQLRIFEYKEVPLPDIKCVDEKTVKMLSECVQSMNKGERLFKEELLSDGTNLDKELGCGWRYRLDSIVMQDILGLSVDEQHDVYNSVEELVSKRVN